MKITGIKSVTSASKKINRSEHLQVKISNDYKKLYYYCCDNNSWYRDDKSETTIFFINQYTSMKEVQQKIIDGIKHIEYLKTIDK